MGEKLLKAVYCKSVDITCEMHRFIQIYSSDKEKEPAVDPESEYTDSERIATSDRITLTVLLDHLYLVLQPASSRRAPDFQDAKESIHLLQEVMKFKGNPLLRQADQDPVYMAMMNSSLD